MLIEDLAGIDLMGRQTMKSAVRTVVVVSNGIGDSGFEMFEVSNRLAEQVLVLEDLVDRFDQGIGEGYVDLGEELGVFEADVVAVV